MTRTNEEIIYHLNALILHFKANYEHQWNKKDIDVFECIVEKLSNSDEDCISRQQAIDKMQELEDEDIKAYGCAIPEGFDGKRAIETLKALPSIQPKPKTDVLDKIKAEIKEESKFCPLTEGLERALEIIDKYKAESEDKHIAERDTE